MAARQISEASTARSVEAPPLRKSSTTISGCSEGSTRVDRKRELWVFFEEPTSSPAAKAYHFVSMSLILLSAVIPVLETLPSPPLSCLAFFAISTVIDAIFLVELCVRWAVSPSNLGFLLRFYNILDMAIVGPLALRTLAFSVWSDSEDAAHVEASWIAQSTLLCVVPAMRLIKALRTQRNFTLLMHTLHAVVEPLCVPLLMLMVMCMVFSCMLYVIEPRDSIVSVPHAIWLVIVTISTVGYGDMAPSTDLGKFVTCILVFCGCLCMAMPIGIVGTAFTETWRNRGKILALRQVRDRLRQWGFTDDDLRELLKTFDHDQSGEIEMDEFSQMIASMHLGLTERQISRLFAIFDVGGFGVLDSQEFVEAIGLSKTGGDFSRF